MKPQRDTFTLNFEKKTRIYKIDENVLVFHYVSYQISWFSNKIDRSDAVLTIFNNTHVTYLTF